MTIETEEASCPLGCSRGDEFVLRGQDFLQGLPGEFSVMRCCECGLMRTNPRPTPASIGQYYPDHYGPYLGTQATSVVMPAWKQTVIRVLDNASEKLPNLPPGRALEIGCASGRFLQRLSDRGWNASGIEFSESAAEAGRKRGLDVWGGRLEDAPEPRDRFDLCVGWMVLEHLHEPLAVLRKLWRWTHPGGWIAISLPNSRSLEFSLFRKYWYALHLPNHLFHFEPDTATKLLEAGGWRVTRVIHQRTLANLVGSTGFMLRDRGISSPVGEYLVRAAENPGRIQLLMFPLSFLMALLGQTGRMTIWAKRLDSLPEGV